jgi:hypothetical protein
MSSATASSSGSRTTLVGIGAGDHRRDWLVREIDREVGHARRYVEEVTGASHGALREPVAMQCHRLAGQDVDRRLVVSVHVHPGAAAGRNGEKMHADAARADGLGGDAFEIAQSLLAVVGAGRADKTAGRFRRWRHGAELLKGFVARHRADTLDAACRFQDAVRTSASKPHIRRKNAPGARQAGPTWAPGCYNGRRRDTLRK